MERATLFDSRGIPVDIWPRVPEKISPDNAPEGLYLIVIELKNGRRIVQKGLKIKM